MKNTIVIGDIVMYECDGVWKQYIVKRAYMLKGSNKWEYCIGDEGMINDLLWIEEDKLALLRMR